MAELSPLSATVEHAIAGGVVNTPNEAQILDTELDHLKFAVAVTEKHGLQVNKLELPEDQVSTNPFRARGERTVADLDSFLGELERRPLDDAGTLWGNADRGVLTAVYNDHTTDDAGWRDDKLTLSLTKDPDWAAWHAMSGQPFSQNQFGDKIEELLHTVLDPDQATLLEVIDSIRASTSGEFESKIERANGGQQLVYKQEHNVSAGRTGQLEVPQTITLKLRPWEGHPETYEVEAYFRTRVKEGSLALSVKLKPTQQILRDAWYVVTTAAAGQAAKSVYAVK